jgi:hypothetical protein
VQQLYNLIPGPTKEVVFYDSGHQSPSELTHLLQSNLADVLLGKASTENMDVLLLRFPEYVQAKKAFSGTT